MRIRKRTAIAAIAGIVFMAMLPAACGNRERVPGPRQSAAPAGRSPGIELAFRPVALIASPEAVPHQDWKEVRSVDLDGDGSSIVFYTEEDADGGETVFPFLRDGSKLYALGVLPQRMDELEIAKLDGALDRFALLAAIGSASTRWNVIARDRASREPLSFETIGRPERVDLDEDGQPELVAAFEGTHMNFPDVEIIRWADGKLESATAVRTHDAEDPQYAKLVKQGANLLFELGKVREEGSQLYAYDRGKLEARP